MYNNMFVVKIIICLHFLFSTIGTVENNKVNGCILPQHPEFGQWKIYPKSTLQPPGEKVSSGTILEINCKDNYKIDGESRVTCIDENWSNKIGMCLRTCPTINSTLLKVLCNRKGELLESCLDAVEGTRAKIECREYFEDKNKEKNFYAACSDGKWSGSFPECVPVCGRVQEQGPKRIIGGRIVTKGEYTWQVAIYTVTDKELICGGTLLNRRMVLTAAHCVTDVEGNILPKEDYIVATGKHYRQYNHSDDATDAQFSSVSEIHIPEQYKAYTQNYLGDIAVIITTQMFNITKNVGPICINRNPNDYHNIPHNSTSISGWGFTVEYKDPSSVLKHLEVPIVDDKECRANLPEDFITYMTHDKLCAGFLNSSTSICKGDSGGGLVSKINDSYYIIAVVSVSPLANSEEGGCDSQQYGLYTKFWYYMQNFLSNIEAQFKHDDCNTDPYCGSSKLSLRTSLKQFSDSGGMSTGCGGFCVVPIRPNFSTWKAVIGEEFSPIKGIMVPPTTVLAITCSNGYTLDGESTTTCIDGKWSSSLGHCLENCHSLTNTSTTFATCSYKNKTLENCNDPPHETLATFSCAPYYYDESVETTTVSTCWDGRWNVKMPECEPVCGQKYSELSNIRGKEAIENYTNSPWHVGIYTSKDKKWICSGTLVLKPWFVLTARHCLLNSEGELLNGDEIIVAAGKMYRLFNDSRDRNPQYSEVVMVEEWNTYVVALYLTTEFNLTNISIPACADPEEKLHNFAHVSSWGFNTCNNSDYLRDVKIFFEEDSKCPPIPKDEIFVFDQFCGRTENETSACQIDIGSGLVQELKGKHYFVGAATTSDVSLKNKCENLRYTWYTMIRIGEILRP